MTLPPCGFDSHSRIIRFFRKIFERLETYLQSTEQQQYLQQYEVRVVNLALSSVDRRINYLLLWIFAASSGLTGPVARALALLVGCPLLGPQAGMPSRAAGP